MVFFGKPPPPVPQISPLNSFQPPLKTLFYTHLFIWIPHPSLVLKLLISPDLDSPNGRITFMLSTVIMCWDSGLYMGRGTAVDGGPRRPRYYY